MAENKYENLNDQLVLISGESGSGKSASLQALTGGKRVLYLNCESGKRLPFKNTFTTKVVSDPYQIHEAFEYAATDGKKDFDTIVIDTLTFLMDMFESQYVLGSDDTMKGWQQYQQFFKKLMQTYVAESDKSVIFLAHTRSELDEKAMQMMTSVPIKGALKNNGIEAYFSTVVSTKKITLSALEPYTSNLLNLTERDKLLGFKHVFQTQLTKATVGERIRSPMGMFTTAQTYTDNDAQLLLNHLKDYYA
jgi:KaiC/GvpD/RAD55 family RecA-like ATPase